MSKKPLRKAGAKPPKPQLVTKTGDRKMPKTDVQRFLEEEQERASKKQEMIQVLLAERDEKMKEYDEQLKLLGYSPSLTAPRASTKRQRDPNKPCPICNVPGHDARAHRSQGKNKKPFTAAELSRLSA